ncbi:MAG: hypothetical protein IKO99_05315 [Bacteroidales bacterium]|nr:hypothetical protein [Bacteroidales bacterium]
MTENTTATSTEIVNKDRPVYISYASNSSEKPEWEHIADCAAQMFDIFNRENIEYRTNGSDSDDKISDFGKTIGTESEVVVIVFSDKYFRSAHCMYEFSQIKKSLAKNPDKKLLCIKSGNFDLSNVNYILELEHYWGNIRQEYDEIEYHHQRNHTEAEKVAFENGFYVSDIRQLYTFFSALNYQNAAVADLEKFVLDIQTYYKTTPAPSSKSWKKKVKFPWKVLFLLLGIFLTYMYFRILGHNLPLTVIKYPSYSQNDFYWDGTFITAIEECRDDTTLLHFRTNNSDIYNIPFSFDTAKCFLEYFTSSGKDTVYLSDYTVPEKDSLADSVTSYIEYSLKFPVNSNKLSTSKIFNFVDSWYGIFDIEYSKIYDELKYPEYSKGNDGCFLTRIEDRGRETRLYFHLINLTGKDSTIYVTDEDYIFAKGKKHYFKSAIGIPIYPNRTKLRNGTAVDFVLIFEPLSNKIFDDPDADFIHLVGKTMKFQDIKLYHEDMTSVENPETSFCPENITVSEVEYSKDETKVYFKVAPARHGFRFAVSPESYIVAGHKKYGLRNVSGVTQSPDSVFVPSGTPLEFALIYPPVPEETEVIDCILCDDVENENFISVTDIKIR